MKYISRFALFLCLALWLTACNPGWFDDFIGEPSSTPQPTQAVQITSTPIPTPKVINVTDLSVGLDSLSAYRVDFTATFEYVDMAGTMIRRMISYLYLQNGTDYGYYLRVSNTDDPTEIFQQSGIYQVDNKYFQIYGTELVPVSCNIISESLAIPLFDSRFIPERVVGVLTELTLDEKNVTIDGMLADRFTFTHENQQLVDYRSSFGEVWVEQTSGLILRLMGQAQGVFDLVGHTADGLISWEYLLSEINILAPITLPEICETLGIIDFPLPEGGQIENQREGFISYLAPLSPEESADFFRQTYPDLGWILLEDAYADTTYVMTFTLDTRKVYITLAANEGEGSRLLISEFDG